MILINPNELEVMRSLMRMMGKCFLVSHVIGHIAAIFGLKLQARRVLDIPFAVVATARIFGSYLVVSRNQQRGTRDYLPVQTSSL